MKKHITYVRSYDVERVAKGGKSYRWTTGYVRQLDNGNTVFPPVTRREAYHEARKLGGIAKFTEGHQCDT